MKAGDNAPAPAHAGPLNHREGFVTQTPGASPKMMVASESPNGVPLHRPGPAFPVHRSFNAEKCRHEGCITTLQSGTFCKQHMQFPGGADANGNRKPPITRNVPIVPSQPRTASFNGMHGFQRQDAPPYAGLSPSNGKKQLPERLTARKSTSTTPSVPARTGSPSLYASNTSQPNDARPHKRQRVTGSYEAAEPPQSARPRFSNELQGLFDGGRPRPAHGSPLQPNMSIPPSRPQPAVHQHPNGLHSPVTTDASPAASPAWGSPHQQSRPLHHGPQNSPPGTHPPASGRLSNGHSGPSNGASMAPSQQTIDQRGMDHVQQLPISREYRLGSNGVASPLISQESAVALYAKHRRDNMSNAELKARMQDAKLCSNARSPVDEMMTMTSLGGQNGPTRNGGQSDSTANSRPEQPPPRAVPVRPTNWRPTVPSMSTWSGWSHGPAAIDLTRSSSSPIEIPGSRPQSSGNPQAPISQVKTTTNATTPSPDVLLTSVELDVRPGKDEEVAILQESIASPKPAVVTSELQKVAVDSTAAGSRPTSRQNRTPTKQKNTRHQPISENIRVVDSFSHAKAPEQPIANPSNASPFPVKSDTERRQRIQRQLEAAKRAEDALRRGLALMPSDSITRSATDAGRSHNDAINGTFPSSTTSSDSGIAFFPSSRTEGSQSKGMPEPERRRRELVKKHDPAKLDGFIYGELNEPCRPMSRLFDLLPEERPLRKAQTAQRFAYIDPRVHWTKPQSRQWHDDMRAKLQERGNKKKSLGKVAARQARRKRDGSPVAKTKCLPMVPPERVAADPKWLAALKVLDDMAAKHHADQKSKAADDEIGKTSTSFSAPTKETETASVNEDVSVNRRSGRHNARQTNGVKSADTTPRRVLRTKSSARQLHATVEDADESEDEDEEHSAYGGSGGRKMDVDPMEIDTTPTRRRR